MRVPGRRYVLLETLRAYGAELLAEDGTADDVGRRHAFYVVEQIEAADRALIGPRADRLLENIDAGLPELRVAFSWLLEHGELEAAGRIMVALWNYGFLRLRPDVLAWADRLTAADAGDHSPLAAGVWAVSAQAAWMAGDLAETARRTERAAAVAETLDGGRVGEGGDDAGEPGALRRSAGRLGAPLPPGQGVGVEPGAGPHRTRLRGAGAGVRRATQRPRSRPPPCSRRWGTTSAPTPPTPGTAPESPTSPATPIERGSGLPAPSISRSAAGHRS